MPFSRRGVWAGTAFAAALAAEAAIPHRYSSMDRGLWRSAPLAATEHELPAPRFVEQRQDHFDGSNPTTWHQAYYVNDTFWKVGSDAPVFLCVGGEGPPLDGSAVVSSVHCNVAVEWMQETGALMFALEHRYYGCHNSEACPVSNLSQPGALRFLSSRQALGDVAGFVEFAKSEYKLSEQNKWVTWGGSYPGMLAGWARLKFPHLIHASVSSSAPVRAQLDMVGYNDVMAEAYSVSHEKVNGSPACREAIATGHAKVGELFDSEEGRSQLADLFGGAAADYAKPDFQVEFAGQGVAAFPGQENDPACEQALCNIGKVCAVMTDAQIGTEVHRLAAVRKGQQALRSERPTRVRVGETPTPGYGNGDQLWAWQTCTEFGFYQTCEKGSKCMWTQGLATVDEEMSFCQTTFNISKDLVAQNIAYSNAYYGADHPAGTRVLYVNGECDPWNANSIRASVSPLLPAMMVNGSSHHFWTHPSLPTDQASVVAVRGQIRELMQNWLQHELAEAASPAMQIHI